MSKGTGDVDLVRRSGRCRLGAVWSVGSGRYGGRKVC